MKPDNVVAVLPGGGTVQLVECWGKDSTIIEAARMSTGKGFKGWGTKAKPGDEKLLKYLWQHKHTSPFEQVGVTFEVVAPLFVARQWMRHRTFSYSEHSARYSELPEAYYVPHISRLQFSGQSKSNTQVGDAALDTKVAAEVQVLMDGFTKQAQALYKSLLDKGLAREVARTVLPVSIYTKFRVSGNLRNWLHFISLRDELGAQYEIRVYAGAIAAKLTKKYPRTMAVYRGFV